MRSKLRAGGPGMTIPQSIPVSATTDRIRPWISIEVHPSYGCTSMGIFSNAKSIAQVRTLQDNLDNYFVRRTRPDNLACSPGLQLLLCPQILTSDEAACIKWRPDLASQPSTDTSLGQSAYSSAQNGTTARACGASMHGFHGVKLRLQPLIGRQGPQRTHRMRRRMP